MAVTDPIARVAEHCRRHALLPSGTRILLLVSGGADSTCLMGLLHEIHDGPLLALTLDHGLRVEAAEECDLAVANAEAMGIPALRRELGVTPGPGVQARARAARLAEAARVADAHGCALVATGHTATDQAETVLFRLARGTGTAGALGMAPRAGRVVRPLLALTRAETRRWCRSRGLPVSDDPSNRDSTFARVRVRETLMPALRDVSPGAERNVAAFAEALADERDLLEDLVADAWRRAAREDGLDLETLRGERPALARILMRRLIAGAGLEGDALGRAAVERAMGLLGGARAAQLPGGVVRDERGRAIVVPDRPPRPVPVERVLVGGATT